MQRDRSAGLTKAGLTVQTLCALTFVAIGLFLGYQSLRGWLQDNRQQTIVCLVVGVLFTAFGVGFITTLWGRHRKQARQRDVEERHADAPWLTRPDWASGQIKSNDAPQRAITWFFGLGFGLGSIPFLMSLPTELRGGNTLALIGLIIPAAGIGALSRVAYLTVRSRKFGASVFKMAPVPGLIGGTLTGGITVSTRLQSPNGVRLQLQCVRRVTTGSGKNRSTSEDILWEDEKTLRPDLPQTGPDKLEIPVFFQIPADCEPSGGPANNHVVWLLTAAAKTDGVDFRAQFELPVFRIAGQSAGTALVMDGTARHQMPFNPTERTAQLGIRIRRIGGGTEYLFPAGRNTGLKWLVTFWWLVLTAGFVAVIHYKAGLLPIMVLGLFDTLVTIVWVNAWARSSRIIAGPGQLTVSRSWFGLGPTRQFARDEIAQIQAASTLTTGEQVYYDIELETITGSKITAASAIRSKQVADWLAQELGRTVWSE